MIWKLDEMPYAKVSTESYPYDFFERKAEVKQDLVFKTEMTRISNRHLQRGNYSLLSDPDELFSVSIRRVPDVTVATL